MQKNNIITISKPDQNYPKRLNNLHQPPKQIYIRGGDINSLFKLPAVGIVGSRKATNYGKTVTKNLASILARHNILIVSGLALGIDSLAHEAALEANGKALAVLPSGIEKIYPASHSQLARKIERSGGALLSEYPGKEMPRKYSFIERNRIIAALCDLLLITEAAERSGSLHTAKFALEMGKTVAAVPGDIYSPTSVGCNNLIKTGAQPVTNEQDIIELLNLSGHQMTIDSEYYPEDEAEKAILDLLKDGVSRGEELVARSGMDTGKFQQVLTTLEIKDVIVAAGNNRWRIK